MVETIRLIIKDVLKAIYQPFVFALVLSVFVMFFVMYLDKYKEYKVKQKLKKAFKEWGKRFKESVEFRRLFYLIFFCVMILFRTLMNRDMWTNPIVDVIGTWGLHKKDGTFTAELFENTLLFVPLIFFLFFYLEKTAKKVSKFLPVMGKAIASAFLFSLTIEVLQLFLHVGTWQLSDLCFNTLGGLIGGFIYWISVKVRGIK